MGIRKGSITVFLALVFVCIAALMLGIVESARTCGARLYMQVGADAAMESLFSQFHRKLWEDYRILGLEYRDDAQLQEEFYEFMLPYIQCKDWYQSSLKQKEIMFSEHALLTEDAYFEEEILDYMKYGLADSLIRFCGMPMDQTALQSELQNMTQRVEESETIRGLQAQYQLGAKDVAKLEDALCELARCTEAVQEIHDRGSAVLGRESASDFYKLAGDFCGQLTRLQKAVEEYLRAADQLAEKVTRLRDAFEAEKATLSAESIQAVDTEISEYESYVDKNGMERRKIISMEEQAEQLKVQSLQMEQEVREFEDWISQRLREQDPEDEDYYDYRYEIAAFYGEMQQRWKGMQLVQYEGEVSQMDQQTKKALDRIGEMVGADLLKLVLPDGVALPDKAKIHPTLTYGVDSRANFLEKLVLGEYALRYFHYYQERDEGAVPPNSGCMDYELEYLICGKDGNYQNLSEVVLRLLALREGMNFIYLCSDAEKRNEARVFVTQFLCITANPALIMVLSYFVLGIWALGQAIVDIRTLLEGERVPLFHTGESWSLGLDGLLQLGKNETLSSSQGEDKGLSYRDYLRIFLYGEGLAGQKQVNRRMLTRIQTNIRTIGTAAQGAFSLDHCLYAMKASVRTDARHLMYQLNLLKQMSEGELEAGYSIGLETYYKYRNETQ